MTTAITTKTPVTQCCQDEIPEDCLDTQCEHGMATMWNIQSRRWEIPPAGPCRAYRQMGNGTFHNNCPGRN